MGVYAITDDMVIEKKEELFNTIREQIETTSKQCKQRSIEGMNCRVIKRVIDQTVRRFEERLIAACKEDTLSIVNTFWGIKPYTNVHRIVNSEERPEYGDYGRERRFDHHVWL